MAIEEELRLAVDTSHFGYRTRNGKKAMYGEGPGSEVLAQVGTDSVQRESMHTLQPGVWLSDEVIHSFYVMLANRDKEWCRQAGAFRKRSHFFKSFFMTGILDEGNDDPALDGKYKYERVKRWNKKVPGQDIFNLDKIFFPINVGRMHWICAVAYMSEKRIQMYDSMGEGGVPYLQSIFQY
jgi:sentrin-specific protease 1